MVMMTKHIMITNETVQLSLYMILRALLQNEECYTAQSGQELSHPFLLWRPLGLLQFMLTLATLLFASKALFTYILSFYRYYALKS